MPNKSVTNIFGEAIPPKYSEQELKAHALSFGAFLNSREQHHREEDIEDCTPLEEVYPLFLSELEEGKISYLPVDNIHYQ